MEDMKNVIKALDSISQRCLILEENLLFEDANHQSIEPPKT